MIAALKLFFRLMLRPMLHDRLRSLLILFAVALGVAVVVAIELSGDAAAGSFHSSLQSLAGDNDLEITATGGVPEDIAGTLARLPDPLRIEPRIDDHATIAGSGETVPLIGVDLIGAANRADLPPLAIAGSRDFLNDINAPDSIWVTAGLGRPGDRIALLINDQTRTFVIRGVIPASAGLGGDAILMDVGAAQRATGKTGRLDRILLRTPSSPDISAWETRLRAWLPPGVQIRPQGAQTAANRRMLAAFRWNLRVLSYVALLVGAFLIYNAISVAVVRRRADIGTLRALGASRAAILAAFLAEAAFFGILGALLALRLGRLLATGAVRLLSTTVNALYVSSRPGSLHLSLATALFALALGVTVAVLSALAPAREAASVPPTEAMARGRREYAVRVERKRDALIALLLALAGALAARLPALDGKPLCGYLAALLFVAAAALATPALVDWITSHTAALACKLLGVEALLAARSLAGSLRRTSVLVGALSTAIAMMTSVGIMVGSFRQTVITWMNSELPADLYLRPAGQDAGDLHPTIDPRIPNRIAQLPGVENVSRFRAYEITYQGLPVTLAFFETDPARPAFSFLSHRSPRDILDRLAQPDTAIVSEPFANKHHVRAGDVLALPIGEHRVPLRILDVFYDYGNEAGFVLVSRANLLRYLPDPAPTNLAVYLQPGADLGAVRREVESVIAHHNLLLFSNAELRAQAVRVFDQTFAITYALEAIAVLVAIMGIAGAQLSIVIDRRREFGVLRFLGASSAQIRRLILIESGLIGILANITGLALGFVLSLVLIFVINKQSFGWTIQFHWPVAVLLGAIGVVYAATVLAGLYPAHIATRLNPIEVVHEE